MRKWRTALAAISFALALAGSFVASRLTGSAQGNAGDVSVENVGQPSGLGTYNQTKGGDQQLAVTPVNSLPTGPSTAVSPATLATAGGGPGNGAGSGTTVPFAMILILAGGLLLARDAFRR